MGGFHTLRCKCSGNNRQEQVTALILDKYLFSGYLCPTKSNFHTNMAFSPESTVQSSAKNNKKDVNVGLVLGLLYLLLPNVLFLLGWLRLWIAVPLSAALLTAGWHIWEDAQQSSSPLKPYSWKDYAALFASFLLAFVILETLGINGHIMQMSDFNVRNAIYFSLIEKPWPLFSELGDYFIYYHIFWLPPALLSKAFDSAAAHTLILYLWIYLGLCTFVLLMFRKWRSKVFILLLLVTFLGSLVDNLLFAPVAYANLTHLHSTLTDYLAQLSNGRVPYHFTTFYGNIFTFNAWVPATVAMGLFLSNSLNRKFLVFIISLIFGAALFQCVPFSILLLILLILRKKLFLDTLKTPESWCGLALGIIYLIFYSGQMGHESASGIQFILSEHFPLHGSNKFFRYFITVVTLLLPPYIILPRFYRKNALFIAMLAMAFIIPLLWIGRSNNELSFKSGQIYYMLFSYLLFLSWQRAAKWRKLLIAVFLAVSSVHVFGDLYRRHIQEYGWDAATIQKHILKYDKRYINSTDEYYYYNFHGIVKMPLIQYDKPGESPIK